MQTLLLVLFYRRKVQEKLNDLPKITHSKEVTART